MYDIQDKVTLLLTAAINPAQGVHSLPAGFKEREQIYLDVLRYYAFGQKIIKNIVFIESSAAVLNKFNKLAEEARPCKDIEIISLDQNKYFPESNKRIPSTFLKGYLEAMLIKTGFDKSSLLEKSQYIVKITGRIRLLNLLDILKRLKEPFDFICDYKDHGYLIRRFFGNRSASPYCDSRFFVAKYNFLYDCVDYLLKNYSVDGFVLERRLYEYLNKKYSEDKIIKRLPLEPIFVGRRGHFKGRNYNSISAATIRKVRVISRALMPWFHI